MTYVPLLDCAIITTDCASFNNANQTLSDLDTTLFFDITDQLANVLLALHLLRRLLSAKRSLGARAESISDR